MLFKMTRNLNNKNCFARRNMKQKEQNELSDVLIQKQTATKLKSAKKLDPLIKLLQETAEKCIFRNCKAVLQKLEEYQLFF